MALDLVKVSEEEVTRITDEMQSVLLKTPLSTQSLSEGMRHASSAMAVFTQNSQRTGDDLENYKKEILTTTLALEGSFSRLGKFATSYSNICRKPLNCWKSLRAS